VSVNVRRNLAVTLTPAGGTNPLKLRVTTSASPKIGSALTISFAAYGGVAPYAYSVVAGSLPTGMGAVNSGTGLSTGTPTTVGTYTFTAQVQDAASTVFKITTTVTISHVLIGVNVSPSNFENGISGVYQFSVSGNTGAVTWANTGAALPSGATLSSGGLLSLTNAVAVGTTNLTVTATDAGSGDVVSFPCTLLVDSTVSLASTPSVGTVNATVGVPYYVAYQINTFRFPNYFISITSNPASAWLTVSVIQPYFNSSGTLIWGQVVLSGTPSPLTYPNAVTTVSVAFQLQDAAGASVSSGATVFVNNYAANQPQQAGSNVGTSTAGLTLNYVGASSVTNSAGVVTVTYTASSLSAQPLSTDLTAIAALTGTGPLNRSGVGTWALGGTLFANGTIGGSAAIDWTKGSQQTATLTASTLSTLAFTAPTAANVFLTLAVTQASGGAGTVAFPGTVQSAPGQITQIFTSANLVTKFVFFYDGTNYWLISSALIFGNPNFGNAYLYAGNVSSIGAAVGKSGTGTYVTWNLSGGGVETNFINQSASATGGWDWRKSDGTTITLIAALDVKGQWKGANYGAAPNNLGVVGATAAIDWTVSHQAKFQQTNGTACTVTFSANPAQPCFLDVTAQGSAAGAGGAITWPAVKGTAMTGTGVTTAKFSNYLLWWDGTNYWVINQQINA
jgi:hypothetical protein